MESTTEQTIEAMSSLESGGNVSADDWFKGIALSVLASIIGGASKLAIRKSWLMQRESQRADGEVNSEDHDENTSPQLLTLDDVGESTDSSQNIRVIPQWIPYCLRYSAMFGMSVLNPICCVLAMNYASPSILAPFSGLTLVWVILFSHPVVGEKPTNPQVIAALLIITGEVIVAVFGDHTNDAGVTVEDVRESYGAPAFVTYFVVLTLYMVLLTHWILHSRNHILRRFAWGSFGGAMTGSQNFLKDSLTIIKATDDGLYPWFFYVFLLFAAFSAFGGLLFLTACMKRYDATYSAASFVGSFVVTASIMSAAHYNTFKYLKTVWNYVLYPAGLVVLMVGVYVLVRESREVGEDDSEDSGQVRRNSKDLQSTFDYKQVEDDTTSGSSTERAV